MQQCEDAKRSVSRDQVEIGHAATDQRVAFAEIVPDAQAGHLRGELSARFIDHKELGHDVPQRRRAIVGAQERDLRHRHAQHARRDRVPLGMIGVEECLR